MCYHFPELKGPACFGLQPPLKDKQGLPIIFNGSQCKEVDPCKAFDKGIFLIKA